MIYTEYQKHKDKQSNLSPTGSDIEGPFYKPNAPNKTQLCNKPNLFLSGIVTDITGKPIPNATLDFWQADDKGIYHDDAFRGKQLSTKDGTYFLNTMHPGDYQISETEYRCAHIHVKVTAEGYKPLTTQLYFLDDKYNNTDHWFNQDRVIGHGDKFNFVLAKDK